MRKAEEYEIIRRQIQELYQELEKEKEGIPTPILMTLLLLTAMGGGDHPKWRL